MNQASAVAEPMASLEIRKSADAALAVGGLRFVACRREVDVIDGGITLYVHSALPGDDRELLRFDLFRHRPHYHAPASNEQETVIDASRAPSVDEGGVENVTGRAGELIDQAGFSALRSSLDFAAIRAAAPALRRLLAGLAEPTEISHFPIPAARLAEIRGDAKR